MTLVSFNDYNAIVSAYIYGTTTPPVSLTENSIIRDATQITPLDVSVVEYMTEGAGRFGKGPMSSLIDQFFRPDVYGLPSVPVGSYTKGELAAIFNNSNYGIAFQQYNYVDGLNDVGVRTFLWNSTALMLSDDSRFVVAANGERYIENYSLVPRFGENFDFESGDLLANLTAEYLQDNMDISRIGNKVILNFVGTAPVTAHYGADEFYQDMADMEASYVPVPTAAVLDQVNDILNGLWASGVTKFLDDNGRPIIYGTNGDDSFSPGYFKNDSTSDADSIFDSSYFTDYLGNGFHLIGGDGDDILVASADGSHVTSADLMASTIFQTFHSEWDNGLSDFLSGGNGADVHLIASTTQLSESFYTPDGLRAQSGLREALGNIDYIDGSDSNYVAHFECKPISAAIHEYFSLTDASVQSALSEGGDILNMGMSNIYYDGSWLANSTIDGVRIETANLGAFILLTTGGSWGQDFYGAITVSRDLSDSAGAWIILGSGEAQQDRAAMTSAAASGDVLRGGNSADSIYAYGGDDVVILGAYGGGRDFVDGGSGIDTVDYSATSADLAISVSDSENGFASGLGAGNDDVLVFIENIVSGGGSDVLTGSDGANVLDGGSGNDLLSGGAGDDRLFGGSGSDVYRYLIGDGNDVIEDWGDAGAVDAIQLGAGISSDAVVITRGDSDFWDMKLGFSGGGSITVKSGFISSGTVIEEVRFSGGAAWTATSIREMYLDQQATSGNDYIHGFIDTADTIAGGGGNDELYGYSGDDILNGNEGNDVLFGNEGADRLIGEAGDDFMIGGEGADIYVFNSTTEGADWVEDFAGGDDRIDLSAIAGFDDFSDVLAIAQEWGGTTWLNFDQNNSIRLQNVTLSSLSAWDFVFA